MSGAARIPETPMKGIAGALFVVAFLAAVSRTTIQLKKRRPLSVDSAFFAFACVCLGASTVILYQLISALYFIQRLVQDPSAISPSMVLKALPEWLRLQRLSYTQLILTWTVIFSVKFSFLFFFKILTKRLANLDRYRRVVVWISAVSFVFCVSDVFITCPQFSLLGAQCWTDTHSLRPFILTTITLSLDILTDVLIVAIPVRLLWEVQLKPRQKLRLGLPLCLGIFMIMTAIAKTSGLRSIHCTSDIAWIIFWHHAQGCIAVFMISLTTFRSLFVSQNFSSPRPNILPSRSAKLRSRTTRRDQDLQWTNLPSIPVAALTGMRSFIGRSSGSPLEVEEPLSEHNSHTSVTPVFSVSSEHKLSSYNA